MRRKKRFFFCPLLAYLYTPEEAYELTMKDIKAIERSLSRRLSTIRRDITFEAKNSATFFT